MVDALGDVADSDDPGRLGLEVVGFLGAGVMRVAVLVGEEVAVVRGGFVPGDPTISVGWVGGGLISWRLGPRWTRYVSARDL